MRYFMLQRVKFLSWETSYKKAAEPTFLVLCKHGRHPTLLGKVGYRYIISKQGGTTEACSFRPYLFRDE
ncbi:hypothetical protein J2S19_002023 [Metabacillus malikii]|uniref:Uncharacterized protein n=1 Tax=Metabacillus malikii TaxID=1504265 RepID=A0ABT9ZG43_9BACI|nr:hypothetical protein [Metabacillus malikii]